MLIWQSKQECFILVKIFELAYRGSTLVGSKYQTRIEKLYVPGMKKKFGCFETFLEQFYKTFCIFHCRYGESKLERWPLERFLSVYSTQTHIYIFFRDKHSSLFCLRRRSKKGLNQCPKAYPRGELLSGAPLG